MAFDLLLTVAGIGTVLLGGYLLVQSAVVIAIGFGISRAVVGATVVAFGTSAPELMVGTSAVLRGSDGVTVGNIIGACVGNVGLVLGLAALLNPAVLFTHLRRSALPVLGLATVLFLVVGIDGEIARWEGGLMVFALVGAMTLSPRLFPEIAAAAEAEPEVEARRPVVLRDWAQLAGAVIALAAGSQVALEGVVGLGERLGLSEVALGVVVVSLGTSLPETITSVLAAVRKEYEIAVANVLGSNIFNLLGVMGIVALLAPVTVDPGVYRLEVPALVISTLALTPFAMSHRSYRVTRLDGMLLLFLYVSFAILVVDRGL